MKHEQSLREYKLYLYEKECSQNTIQKYVRDIKKFLIFLDKREFSKVDVMQFKEWLVKRYAPRSVNSMLAAVNGFLGWLGLEEYKAKPLKIQRELFAYPEKELSQKEYERLVQVANGCGRRKWALLLQTICATGIRVSELEYITVSALHTRRVTVECKRKNRVIFLPQELCKSLIGYCREQKIQRGSVFVTKTGKSLNRSNIWKMMKRLCGMAHIAETKVFPHNLRHLFARTYYKIEKDISRLADILGHSNINTTRIYTMETGSEHAKRMERMGLVCRDL